MTYHYLPTSVPGFVQQLAVAYIARGYFFYVAGHIPPGKRPEDIDRKLLDLYDVPMSRWQRARRRLTGRASMQYLRYGSFWLLIATHGKHEFFERERAVIRDVRREPISFAGYSIGYRRGRDLKWHASVRIHPNEYRWLKQFMVQFSRNATTAEVEEEFARFRFEPYAPVVRQLFSVLRMVNRTRKSLGLEAVPAEAVRTRRQVVRAFEDGSRSFPNPLENGPRAPEGAKTAIQWPRLEQ
ncbi:MAG: hypothetical protein RLN60_03980 [Phycisphaerales bacterium]